MAEPSTSSTGWSLERLLAPSVDVVYAAFRIVVGLLLAFHGPQLLLGWWGGIPVVGGAAPLLSASGVGGALSLVGGLLVALGLFTTPAAFVSSGMLAVGYAIRHAPHGWLPITNGGEPATFFAFALLYIAARGPGRLSADRAIRRSRGAPDA